VKIQTLKGIINMIFAKKRPEANLKAFELGVKAIKKSKPL